MPKGIIVIDLPESCAGCDYWYEDGYNCRCVIGSASVNEYISEQTKAPWCPIKPIPDETRAVIVLPGDEKGLIESSMAQGWNTLRDKILEGIDV